MRGVNDPYGSPVPLVDKMIGTAYDVVRYVAHNIPMLEYIKDNMEKLHTIYANLKTTGLVLGSTTTKGATVSIGLPTGVTMAKVLSSSVMIVTDAGDLYPESSGYFTTSIQNEALRLHLNTGAPDELENAVVRWFITYGA